MAKQGEKYEAFLSFVRTRPDCKAPEVMRHLNISEVTYYRYKKRQREQGDHRVYETFFDVPKSISQKILPPKQFIYTHLAAYITRFHPDELIPPYNKTAGEIMFEIKNQLNSDPVKGSELVFGLQDKLALYALYTGDVNAFKNSKGKVQPPERYL